MPSDSLRYGGLELLGGPGGTYNVLDGQGSFGDPQAVVQTVRSLLTNGSFVSGTFSDNRTVTLTILIQASDRLGLSLADSALRVQADRQLNTLTWSPVGGFPVLFDAFRGQVAGAWSGGDDSQLARTVTLTFAALPFGRSDLQQRVGGATTSIALGNFHQGGSQYTYSHPHLAFDQAGPYPSTRTGVVADALAVAAICNETGTAYGNATTIPPYESTASLQMDLVNYRGTYIPSANYWVSQYVGKTQVVSGTWDLSTMGQITLAVYSDYSGAEVNAYITLTDSHSASQTLYVGAVFVPIGGSGWHLISLPLSSVTLDKANLRTWQVILGNGWLGTNQGSVNTVYLGMLRAFPASSSTTVTTNGAVYKLSGILGDAQAPASLEFDRGGSATITGCLAYRAPSGAAVTTPMLLGLTSGAGATVSPSTLSGTFRMIVAKAVGTIGVAQTLTVTQRVGATTVASAVLAASQVNGGSKWADCGDLTLPLIDMPAQAGNVTYGLAFSDSAATEVMICDTRGALVWVPTMTPAPFVWIDEATASGAGGVYAGVAADRSNATSLLGLAGAQAVGAMTVDPGDNYLLVYVIDGAATNVTLTYYDRYLGENTSRGRAAASTGGGSTSDLFQDLFRDTF